MSQHARDRFGNEAPRGQDAAPIDRAVEQPANGDEPRKPENLTELRALGTAHSAPGPANPAGEEAAGSAATAMANAEATHETNAEMSARVRRAAHDAQEREVREQSKRHHAPTDTGDALHALEDQGFSENEAMRLIAVTERLDDSAEARDAEATLQRLRFTRWLVEQGKLDEWSE